MEDPILSTFGRNTEGPDEVLKQDGAELAAGGKPAPLHGAGRGYQKIRADDAARTTPSPSDRRTYDNRKPDPVTRPPDGRATVARFEPVITTRALAGGGVAALIALGRVAFSFSTIGPSGQLNDFYDYWAAGVQLNRGHNPYDVTALAAVQQAAGLHIEAGSGYSYPLFFAHLMRPLALLPPTTAAAIFSALSLVALAFAVALLLGSLGRVRWPVAIAGGAVAGLFPPVIGSLYFGQANLLVLLLLAVAYRCVAPGPLLGVAAAIKLYPFGGFMAALTERPPGWRVLRNGLGVTAALLLLQLGTGGGSYSSRTGYFLGPDTYWSNESINGWLSRLGIDSTWTRAPLPGFPVEAAMVVALVLITTATVVVLLRAPQHSWQGALALSLWLSVVAAPKNSLWNFTPLLLAVTFIWRRLDGRWWLFLIGAASWLLLEVQAQLDSLRETIYQASPALAWLSSVGLYGGLILGGLTAYVLLRPGSANRRGDRDAHPEFDVGRAVGC